MTEWKSVTVPPVKSGTYDVIIMVEDTAKTSPSIYEGCAEYGSKKWTIDGDQTNRKVILWRNKNE